MVRPAEALMSAAEFEVLRARLRDRGTSAPRADTTDRLAELPIRGRVVSAGQAPPSGGSGQAGPGRPFSLRQWTEGTSDWTAVNDRIGLDIHGSPSMTHIDAPSHFAWHAGGGGTGDDDGGGTVESLAGGLVARGVLLDVPALLGHPVPTGHVVTLGDIDAVVKRQGIDIGPGDALWIRFGRTRNRSADDVLGVVPEPGLSIECAEWLAAIGPSAVVTDCGLDPTPSEIPGLPVPWHLLLLTSLGVPLVDVADLDRIAASTQDLGRWEFLSVIAPLHLPGASGSPVNPLAIL